MKRKKNSKFKLFWRTRQMGDGIGNAFGYTMHNRNLRRHVAKIAELTENAPCAMTITSPEMYVNPEKKYVNFLFTMFEGTTLPDIYIKSMEQADYLIAPSTWVKERFNEYFPPDKTFICPHGVDPVYTYVKRELPRRGEPFIYLWVGAPNPRKGFEEIIVTWKHVGFINDPNIQLYIKTTRVKDLQKNVNVILDGRRLTIHQLVHLYQRAHCFLMPSRGEGWGLTLLEAMATGCPCIATNYSGMTDFFDDTVGYPLDYHLEEGTVIFPGTQLRHDTMVAISDIVQMQEYMIYVREHYEEALKKGFKAHQRARQFTWPRSARILIDGMREKMNGIK